MSRSESHGSPGDAAPARVRLDRWLWAARFFKTRALAKTAVEAGHVQVAGQRAKPAREIGIGAALTIRRGDEVFEVTVCGLAERRGPAREAQALYEEAQESVEARAAERSLRRMANLGLRVPARRPDGRARRQLRNLRQLSDEDAADGDLDGTGDG